MGSTQRGTATVLAVTPDDRLDPILAALQSAGIDTIETVPDVGAALEAIETDSFDVVLVLDAPGDDGYDDVDGVTQVLELTTLAEAVPIVAYVTRSGHRALVDLFEAGVEDVCRVPPEREELLARKLTHVAGVGDFDDPETQLASLFDSYPQDIFLKDDLNRFVKHTGRADHLEAFDREWIVNLTEYELFPRDFADSLFEEEQAMLDREEGVVEKVEHYRTPAGEDRWVSTSKVPRYDDDGEVIGVSGSSLDVTDVKRHERLMAALNEASQRLTQAETRDEIARTTVDIAAELGPLPHVQVALYDDRGTLQPVTVEPDAMRTELPFETHGRWYERVGVAGTVYAVPPDVEEAIPDDGDEDVTVEQADTGVDPGLFVPLGDHGIVGFVTDGEPFDEFTVELAQVLASNVEAALDRAERERRLAETNERLRQFALLGSHELRNRLQTAYGRLARIDDDQAEALEETITGVDRLVTQLVTLARNGTLVRGTDTVDLASVARTAWDAIDAPQATLRIEDTIGIRADEDALIEIFGHLLRNAIEHAGSTVTVTVGADPETPGFFVADDGPGIPSAQLDSIFEFSYDDAASRSGYGLYIVATIADSHDWTVTSATSRDGGARIEIGGVDIVAE